MFQDRGDAGRQLAKKLIHYKNSATILVAIPRGGVPVAAEIALQLQLPIEILLVKKIGHPANKEYAIGAIGIDHEFIVPHENNLDSYIANETICIRERLKEMKQKYNCPDNPIDLKNKIVIIVDDGIATGNTLLASIAIIKEYNPKKIVVAVPVISHSATERIQKENIELVTLEIPDYFTGVGAFYENFKEVNDEEVDAILKMNKKIMSEKTQY